MLRLSLWRRRPPPATTALLLPASSACQFISSRFLVTTTSTRTRGSTVASGGGSSSGPAPLCPTRLLRAPQFSAHSSTKKLEEAERQIPLVRNLGIVAHIDAGKTTTTERMLYYAGVLKRIGEVDSGTTTTDFMKEEMERGITIQSAAVSLAWRGHALHLIDTPGHVDFTVEVERAMRVVDGVVALFDASAGVQAQSYTVLQQSRKFGIPVLAFLNKMDKYNADFDKSVASIQNKLQVQPLLLQLPLKGEDGSFEGVIDVVEQKSLRFSGEHGADMVVKDLTKADHGEHDYVVAAARHGRHELLAHLTAADDALSETLIGLLDQTDGDEAASELALPAAAIRAAIRRLVLRPRHGLPMMPVLCGASRRDQGVQPLLDAITYYLPAPTDRHMTGLTRQGLPVPLPPPSCLPTVPTVALAFKVMHAVGPKGHRQPLVFIRVYSGCVVPKMVLANHSQGRSQTVDKLYVMHANAPVEVPHLAAGDIGAAFLNETYTGDTLFAPPARHLLQAKQHLKPHEVKEEVFTLEGIEAPPAVLAFSVEAASSKQVERLETALAELGREDPSLRVTKSDFGNVVLRGMGELHLDIVMSRLQHEHGVQCRLLRAVVEYRETVRTVQQLDLVMGLHHEVPYLECSLRLVPLLEADGSCSAAATCAFRIDDDFATAYKAAAGGGSGGRSSTRGDAAAAREELAQIEAAFATATRDCTQLGPLAGLPLHGVHVVLTHVRKTVSNAFQDRILQQVARTLVGQLLKECRRSDLALLEPMMHVEVHLSDPTYIGNVVSSLNENRAVTVDVMEDGRSVSATVAMRNIVRYTMELRKAVKGHANLFTRLENYRVLEDKAVLARVLKNLGITE